MITMTSKEQLQRQIDLNVAPIRDRIALLSDPDSLADLLLSAFAIRDEASQLIACSEALRLLVGSPQIGEIVRQVGNNPLWHPHLPEHLSVSRTNLDQLCTFLVRWGFPDVAENMSFWGEGVSDEVLTLMKGYNNRKYFLYNSRDDDPPISLDTGKALWQVTTRLGRLHLESYEMARSLSDGEFVTEYMIHMLSYNVPTRCCICYRDIGFWLDCRMIAGAPYCPICFPEEAMKSATHDYKYGKKGSALYWERAAKLLPRRFMAPEPPPKYIELRKQP